MKAYTVDGVRVIQLGFGLIGSALYTKLQHKEGFLFHHSTSLNWANDREISAQMTHHLEIIKSHWAKDQGKEVLIIWSAGQSRFFSAEEDCQTEFLLFKRIFSAIEEMFFRVEQWRVRVLQISSAGGVYEGLEYVQNVAPTKPVRPYGQLKLAQEIHLQGWTQRLSGRLLSVRLSAVYGLLTPRKTMGLLDRLLYCAMTNQEASIFAREDTLRDFIFVRDVSQQLARYVPSFPADEVVVLASGKPTSIFEAVAQVERCMNRKVYAHYTIDRSTASNICYNPSVIAPDFQQSPIATNLRIMISTP